MIYPTNTVSGRIYYIHQQTVFSTHVQILNNINFFYIGQTHSLSRLLQAQKSPAYILHTITRLLLVISFIINYSVVICIIYLIIFIYYIGTYYRIVYEKTR